MVGDTVGPDTPQNVRQEKPRLPPQITAGMCRFFKDLKSHENPGVKIRIEYKEKDALKAICADIGVDYFYPKKNSTYEWLVYPLISLRHAVRVVRVVSTSFPFPVRLRLGPRAVPRDGHLGHDGVVVVPDPLVLPDLWRRTTRGGGVFLPDAKILRPFHSLSLLEAHARQE